MWMCLWGLVLSRAVSKSTSVNNNTSRTSFLKQDFLRQRYLVEGKIMRLVEGPP